MATTNDVAIGFSRNRSELVYSATGSQTIVNTTTETTQFPASFTGRGLTLPPNFWEVGKSLQIDLRGLLNATGTPTNTLRIKLGGQTFFTSTGSLPVGLGADADTMFDYRLTCRSLGVSGQIIGEGYSHLLAGVGLTTANHRGFGMSAAATLDTTQAMTLDVTYQWGAADPANNLTIYIANVTATWV